MLTTSVYVSGDREAADSHDVIEIDTERYRFNKRSLTATTNDATDVNVDAELINDERFRLSRYASMHEHFDDSKSATTYCGQAPRKALMSRACQWMRDTNNYLISPNRLKINNTYNMIFVDDKRKILYCEVPKVACTSWKVFFANLSQNLTSKQRDDLFWQVHDTRFHPRLGFKYLKHYSPEERDYRLKNYYKFMVVRNPYSKVISAWQNKFEPDSIQAKWYQVNVGGYILHHYRKNASAQEMKTGKYVSFEEFIKFVGNPNEGFNQRYDAHWWNMHSVCSPCLFNYDHIAKLETLPEDFESIREHIEPGRPLTLPYLNANTKSKALAEQKKIETFFSHVSEVDLARLKQAYSADLTSFGYSMFDNSLECSLNYHNRTS